MAKVVMTVEDAADGQIVVSVISDPIYPVEWGEDYKKHLTPAQQSVVIMLDMSIGPDNTPKAIDGTQVA